ncbi:MAG: carboxypeptidase-like regulatory domain-containing protein, partial [Muribaculaceae bacterium]|nr:carboxypeptidase-like regulatory domain-containing protein [Muribaculaceae bacterium]
MKKLLILFLFVLGIHIVHAQQMTVTGTVTDASNDEPLVGVTVLAVDSKGTPLKGGGGATTDIDGVYTIKVDAKASLRFSYIGMSNSLVKVNGKSQINVAMQPTTNMLDEVVVTALGINREARSLNYSRQAVDAEAIADNNNGNLVSSLSGKIAGVSITPAGVANGSSRIVIR